MQRDEIAAERGRGIRMLQSFKTKQSFFHPSAYLLRPFPHPLLFPISPSSPPKHSTDAPSFRLIFSFSFARRLPRSLVAVNVDFEHLQRL
jgi:hypothetical protein